MNLQVTGLLAAASIIFVIPPVAVQAQWSDDATLNLAVADRTGEQVQAKIAATTDGGAYVSWFDNSGGGYDVYLQRIDSAGIEQWAHNGVLVADRSFSSTQDYGLDTDVAGNALLAFRDDRFTGIRITAAKVSAAGMLLWGPDGVQLGNSTDFVAAPKIAGTSDGSAVVAWTNNSEVIAQKLDVDGATQWGVGVVLVDALGGSYSVADLQTSDSGSTILSMVQQFGFPSARHLYAQKLAGNGATLWGTDPVAVFDGGSLQFGNFPPFISDSAGGAVFAWYDTSGFNLQCFAQRILASGNEAFAHNGVATSTAARDRTAPAVAFNPQTSETFAVWREEGGLATYGLYAQKYDADGVRQWTDSGTEIIPIGSTELGNVNALPSGDGIMAFWSRSLSFSDQRIDAVRLNSSGTSVWSPAVVAAAASSSGKSRLVARANPDGTALLAWTDRRTDDGDVYLQNLNSDGTLGSPDSDGDGVNDATDNCTALANADQRDTNGDGFGNVCDPDLTGDNVVNFLDVSAWVPFFNTATTGDADFNGDGFANFVDFALFATFFLQPPGPSGVAP